MFIAKSARADAVAIVNPSSLGTCRSSMQSAQSATSSAIGEVQQVGDSARGSSSLAPAGCEEASADDGSEVISRQVAEHAARLSTQNGASSNGADKGCNSSASRSSPLLLCKPRTETRIERGTLQIRRAVARPALRTLSCKVAPPPAQALSPELSSGSWGDVATANIGPLCRMAQGTDRHGFCSVQVLLASGKQKSDSQQPLRSRWILLNPPRNASPHPSVSPTPSQNVCQNYPW